MKVRSTADRPCKRIGNKTRDALQLIPGTEVDLIERCSGHDGTYAVKKEYHEMSMKIGKPVANRVKQFGADHYCADCAMAGHPIANGEVPATRTADAKAPAEDEVDRVISALNAGDRQAAPAAGLAGGDGGSLEAALRVDRISEGVGATEIPRSTADAELRVADATSSSTTAPQVQAGGLPGLPGLPVPRKSRISRLSADTRRSAVRKRSRRDPAIACASGPSP